MATGGAKPEKPKAGFGAADAALVDVAGAPNENPVETLAVGTSVVVDVDVVPKENDGAGLDGVVEPLPNPKVPTGAGTFGAGSAVDVEVSKENDGGAALLCTDDVGGVFTGVPTGVVDPNEIGAF